MQKSDMQKNDKETLEKLKGQLERIVYHNEENGYTVAKVKVFDRSEPVTVVGSISSPIPGEILSMSGEWCINQKFGEQFKIVFCSCSAPSNIIGIEKYLGSGLIKGIGPVFAKRIVAKFGENTLDVIEESPERLGEIEGMGKRRIDMIEKAWAEQKEVRSVMVFLQSYGVSSAYAGKIYKRYGNESIAAVKQNPYRLAYDVWGIGFLTADKMAQKMGFDEKSPLRAEAGLMFALQELTENGHVYCPYEELIAKSEKMLNIGESVQETAIASLIKEKKIVIENLKKGESSVRGVFLSGYRTAEHQTAEMLTKIRDSEKKFKELYSDSRMNYVQQKLSILLAEKQAEAVKAAATQKLLVITGGPGTGKTTVTKAILELFSSVTDKILLAAPTGRAAKRMTEAANREAKTIHRLLQFDPGKGEFRKNSEYPLDCDLIILDEASMIDTLLMYHLLKAVPRHAVLIIVGDTDQLPSVGAGNVLRDIIDSGVFSVIKLNEIFRQARESKIIVNAHRIINGQYPETDNSADTDFYFMNEEDQENVLRKILLMVKERIPRKFGFDPLNDIQVLTPMNRGIVGTLKINESLQDALNPNGFEIIRGGRRYRVGDKVMQIRNNYDKNVFNGDIGLIVDIDTENQTILVNIDGNEINYEYSELNELVLAYAVSVHKSQGSEYPVVVMPLVTAHYIMLQRNLLYTGITRGKKLVIVIGSKKALFLAVKNNKTIERYTYLRERLTNTDRK